MNCSYKTTSYILQGLLLVLLLLIPLTQHRAQAVSVSVVSTILSGPVSQIVSQSTLNRQVNSDTANIQKTLENKEFVRDPLAWGASKEAQQTMTSDMIKWMNSGFDGSPAFVTNYEEYYDSVADDEQVEFIYGDNLNQLCGDTSFKVRTALDTNYQNNKGAGYTPQCTLDDVNQDGEFGNGGWPEFFELVMTCSNDPTCAYLESKAAMYSQIDHAQTRAERELDYGDGFLSMKKCENVTNAEGHTSKRCDITTPGSILQDMLSYQVAELPSQQLLAGDEFNETISSLMKNLSNQVLKGTNGLLGLGGNERFADRSYGSSGGQSYLTALKEAKIEQEFTVDPIEAAISAQTIFITLLDNILDSIIDIENRIADSKTQYPLCFSYELPDELVVIKDDHENILSIALLMEYILGILSDGLEAATTPTETQEVYDEFFKLEDEGLVRTEYQNKELEVLFIDEELVPLLLDAGKGIDRELNRCSQDN